MIALITCGAIGLVMIIFSIILLTGRGSFLIAGFNTMSKSEKEKYDAAALSRFIGKIMLQISMLTIVVGIEALIEYWWFWVIWSAAFAGIIVFALIYANTGNRFKK